MKIAEVIVDVPAKQTDKPFDYLIPEKWQGLVKPGMRVAVPFGPRMVQGFVVDLKSESEFKGLKNISKLLDIEPVLNKELLELGDWLTEETLCYKISAFQAMLPAAMKAKYEKKIRRTKSFSEKNTDGAIYKLFQQKESILWEEIANRNDLKLFQKEIEKGYLEVYYEVKDKYNKKTIKVICRKASKTELQAAIHSMSKGAKKQKEILSYFIDHEKVAQKDLLQKLSTTTAPIKALIDRGLLQEMEEEIYRDPYENRSFEKKKPFKLTEDQEKALAPILKTVENGIHDIFLLYGVTGSGKTEIYLQSIDEVLKRNKQAIMLVPEISLTPQMVKRFKERFGDEVAVLHSGLSIGEKYDEWRKIHRQEVSVVVGARSAIFAPFQRLGIIIIDEEHESSYKQEESPRYHARDVAIKRGQSNSCPVILGSATPTLESFARAKKERYHLLPLRNRMNNSKLPSVEVVDMREELRGGNRSVFSVKLLEKMKDRIEKKEQIVLFLNKRGHSSFVMCRNCGDVCNCPNCEISLTYHRYNNLLKCHYCGYEEPMPSICPSCGSEAIRFFGTGTQKVEEELGKILPEARVIRMDVDTTSKKGSHEKLLTAFQEGKADILLGTQMIAKGLDFPNITLVGVLSADTMLHLPDFRSAEKTFQLLTQVSGRAGRHQLPGEVIIQTYTPDNYAIKLASEQNYDAFFLQEMMLRKQNAYPPYFFIALITVSHEDLLYTVSVTEKISRLFQKSLSREATILGPVASPIARINNRYRYQCLIKYKREPELKNILKKVLDHYQNEMATKGLQITIDLNPQMMM
ncbi:primosomal protein N' [Peribacillus tepidiphilus]|uniref:primosomal protein N' n=1 Tax=Peribacillus tepidiphilus TaxID=2652445 RepID=UPI0035B52E64